MRKGELEDLIDATKGIPDLFLDGSDTLYERGPDGTLAKVYVPQLLINIHTAKAGLNELIERVSANLEKEKIPVGAGKSPEPEHCEDPEDEIIGEFRDLKKPGLLEWEKENRDRIPELPTKTKSVFNDKWIRITGSTYPHGRILNGSEEQEPPKEKKALAEDGGAGLPVLDDDETFIKCPKRPDAEMSLKYCDTKCEDRKDCEAFK